LEASADAVGTVLHMSRRRASSRPPRETRAQIEAGRPPYEYAPGRAERRAFRPWWEYARDRQTWKYAIVGVGELRELTGLEPEMILQFPGTETVTRELPDGRREEALKVPREFVPDSFAP